jgi:hypothetical protein
MILVTLGSSDVQGFRSSGVQMLRFTYPVSSIQHPASSIQHPASSIQYLLLLHVDTNSCQLCYSSNNLEFSYLMLNFLLFAINALP